MKEQEISNIMRKWYFNSAVKFAIINFTKNREFGLMQPTFIKTNDNYSIRKLRVHSVQHFDIMLDINGIKNKNHILNMYYSLASYENGIIMRYGIDKDKLTKWWLKHYTKMNGYDFLIDIDANENTLKYAIESLYKIINLFDGLKIPYKARFSGTGFHIIIPYRYLPKNYSFNPNSKYSIYKNLYSIASKLSEYTEMIDLKIYDSRRLIKVPYSLAIYENNIYCCTQFIDYNEIDNFNINDYTPDKMINKIRNRTDVTFNENGNFYNLLRFFKKREIK